MGNVSIVIDGKKIRVREGSTILEAAEVGGISIPTFCHIRGLLPTGACRVCVVELLGFQEARTLVGSCHTPVVDGMLVFTRTPRVLATRKVIIELMLTGHTGDCVNDPNAENCKLHQLASDYEVGAPRFNVGAERFHPAEEGNPYVRRDLSKCILCRKCVKVCREVARKNVLNIGYRGFRSKVVCGFDEALTDEACRGCLACIEHCPTGALARAAKV